jgi:hypothetical protein
MAGFTRSGSVSSTRNAFPPPPWYKLFLDSFNAFGDNFSKIILTRDPPNATLLTQRDVTGC